MVLQRTPSNGLFFSQGLPLYLIKTFAQAPSKFQSPGFFSFLKVFLSSQREFESPQRHKFCEGDWQNHTQLPAQADMPGLCVLPYYIVRILVLTLKFSVFRRQRHSVFLPMYNTLYWYDSLNQLEKYQRKTLYLRKCICLDVLLFNYEIDGQRNFEKIATKCFGTFLTPRCKSLQKCHFQSR